MRRLRQLLTTQIIDGKSTSNLPVQPDLDTGDIVDSLAKLDHDQHEEEPAEEQAQGKSQPRLSHGQIREVSVSTTRYQHLTRMKTITALAGKALTLALGEIRIYYVG